MTLTEDTVEVVAEGTLVRRWGRRVGGLLVVLALFMLCGWYRSNEVGIPFRDPGGDYLVNRLEISLGIFALWVIVDSLLRAGWPVSLRKAWRTACRRWTWARIGLVWVALVIYQFVYLTYHNLKSWNSFNPVHDAMLERWDHWIFFGHAPAVLLHDVLGQHAAAWILMVWYESFGTLVLFAFPAAMVFAKRLRDGYAGIAAFIWVWILGTASYYLIPSLGPFHQSPADFAGLPMMTIQHTQASYMAQRAALLANPHGPHEFAQVAAFASLHVGVSTVILGAAWWNRVKWLTWAMSIYVAGVCISTVYLGWHFFVDDVAGLTIAVLAWTLGPLTVGVRRRPARRVEADPEPSDSVAVEQPS